MNIRAQAENSTTQADAAYAKLREDILSCRLEPGSKINISEIALKYSLSPGAVREALSRLSAERMTVATAQKGFSVAEVSAAELLDLTRARIAVEQWCLREAIARRDVEWETSIVAAYHRLHRLPLAAPDESWKLNPRWTAAHTTFHEALANGCESPWMLTMRAMLYAQTERYRHLSHAIAREGRDVDAEHKAILDACLALDADAAAELIGAHLTKTSQIVLTSPLLTKGGQREALST